MQRSCTRCERPFAANDLAREVSKGMEAVLFRYYACPACGQYDIFVDVNPPSGESDDAFPQRRRSLEDSLPAQQEFQCETSPHMRSW
jgi:hypothetical protein